MDIGVSVEFEVNGNESKETIWADFCVMRMLDGSL